MRPPENFSAIVDRKKYSTKTATLLCGDDYWDGHNHERRGTQTFLYRTPKGSYFRVHLTQWQGQRDRIEPCDEAAAVAFYEECPPDCQRVPYADAPPGRGGGGRVGAPP